MMIQTTTRTTTPTTTTAAAAARTTTTSRRLRPPAPRFCYHRNNTNQQKLIKAAKGANASSSTSTTTTKISSNFYPKKSLSKATKVTENQLKEMSNLQAKCFFTPILGPNSPLDQLSMFLFQGDVDETLLEKFRYVKQGRFAPLAVMKKTNSEREMGGNKTKETSDTGNIVGVAEVSVQRDVLIGRSIMKFKDLEEANSEYAYVSCMCVDEEYRKMGVATELLRESENVAKKWGFNLLCLHCYEDNIPGISLYKQLGYEELLTDMSLKSPLDIILRKRKVLMCKDLI
jgi:ribosomal protein S18 acetylase RimI-like enzyme|tara:strand:+ start:653 stop:1513 length:861 start_codon:yes stop_codon:yes gene_type:complete